MNDNLKTDVVVIGSGATGLCAALTAAQGGAKVIMFEKERSMGGTANFFEATFAVESIFQRRNYITYSRDDAFKAIMSYSHWRANPRLVRAIVDQSAGTIDWLMEQGVEINNVSINMPNVPMTYHPIKGKGAAVVKILGSKAKELGVDIRLGVPVTGILKNGNKISGVTVEIDGDEVEVEAKAVVIGTGGYANNKEWIKKYVGLDLNVNLFPLGSVDKVGDGIRMAWEAGAAPEGMGVIEAFAGGPIGSGFEPMNQIEMVAINPDLWVDPKGKRFCDEGITFFDTEMGNASMKIREGYTFRLFDDSIVEKYMKYGTEKNMGSLILPGDKPVDFYKEMDAAIARKTKEVFRADSIEELAELMEVDPTALKATVEEYNGFCAKGHDDLFAKDPKYLNPLNGPKFYAVRSKMQFLGTMGGIKINEKTEVIDKKDGVIGGLYAGGFDAAGMWGDSYCINAASGLCSSFAMNSGRLAGKNVLEYIGK